MEEQKKPEYSPRLISLAKNISCNFVDARTTTKDYVRMLVENNDYDNRELLSNEFILSTCLRYEIYNFNGQHKYEKSFLYTEGITCIRRLLSILVGIQSEILGEREILTQVTQSIKHSYDKGCLEGITFQGLQDLISVSESIRESCGVNSGENYSTIAADLFIDRLSEYHGVSIAIVGGGYMADKFFNSLLKTKLLNIEKIYWINRSTSKLESYITELTHLLDFEIKVFDLETGKFVLKEANAIFCALSKSPHYYSGDDYKDGTFVVDVSYPQVFAEKEGSEIVTISNTYFSNLIKEPVAKNSIALANRKIDEMTIFLEKNI